MWSFLGYIQHSKLLNFFLFTDWWIPFISNRTAYDRRAEEDGLTRVQKQRGEKKNFKKKKKKGLYMQMKPRSRKRRRAVWMMKLVWETLQRVYLFRFKFPPNTYRKCFPCERNAWWPFNHYRTFFLSFSSRFPVLPFAFIPSTCWPSFIYMAFYPLCFFLYIRRVLRSWAPRAIDHSEPADGGCRRRETGQKKKKKKRDCLVYW